MNFNEKIVFRKFLSDNTYFFLLCAMSLSLIVWIIQAVNFLDFISEDGHSFDIYFYFTILNYPKIFKNILPFIFFISLFYTISKYEENNELKIFWLNGIDRIKFTNVLIKYTLLFFILQILLSGLLSPVLQNKARTYLKGSNMDFFPSLLQEKKFIDTVDKLTIFIEKKKSSDEFENIFLKDELGNNKSQIIVAKKGFLKEIDGTRKFILFDGKFLNTDKKKTTVFNFSQTEFDLSNYVTKSITHPKVQELSTNFLLKCNYSFYIDKIKERYYKHESVSILCNEEYVKEINQELFDRLIKPIYLFLITIIACFLLTEYKESYKYKFHKSYIFSSGLILIIFSEMSVNYVGKNSTNTIIFYALPLVLALFVYLSLRSKLIYKKK
jgi:lipopolysaccharide export system permease protein